MKWSLALLACLAASNFVTTADAQKAPLSQPVDLVLVKGDDLSKVSSPPAMQLVQTSATPTPAHNVYQILMKNGIAPDSEAISLVYQMNPTISDLNKIEPNTVLTVPAVQGDAMLKKLFQQGDLTQLTVDPDLHQQLNQQIDTLVANSETFKTIPNADTKRQLESLVKSYQLIASGLKRRNGPPLHPQTLAVLNGEAAVLNGLAKKLSPDSTQLTVEDLTQIQAIYTDVNSVMVRYSQTLDDTVPKGDRYYQVTVSIMGGDPNALNTMRVYYTVNGLFRPLPATPPIKSDGFSHLGSGGSEKLLGRNYEIWAARDGDPNHPFTPPYLLKIDDGSSASLTVELSVNAGAKP
jgi:hypothetical protein